MNKRFVIVGCRAGKVTFPGTSMIIPEYFTEATKNHRKGFQLKCEPIKENWYAWTYEIMNACHFQTEEDAESFIGLILEVDKGWFRPLTIMPIYL